MTQTIPRNVARTATGILPLLILVMSPLSAKEPSVAADGTTHVPAFDLPVSSFLGAETRAVLRGMTQQVQKLSPCPDAADPKNQTREAVAETRDCFKKIADDMVGTRQRARYAVTITPKEIAGLYTEVFTPTAGIPPENRKRVLINLHGGGMVTGARVGGQIESIPIAALGKIKVISIDYRMAPEYQFPAASEDVAAVYRSLLKDYSPKNIGIYGCSAGGLLTAQAVAWFLKEGLPVPGAIGMFCAAASYWGDGDAGHVGTALTGSGWTPASLHQHRYFKGTSPQDPLMFPVNAPEVMAKFPPSLLITAVRDFALSSVVHTHSQLVKLGVEADLHVWEGLGHAFFYSPDLPESRDAYEVIVRFFDRHLGR